MNGDTMRHAGIITDVTGERDRARALAAALEEENAQVATIAGTALARRIAERDEAMRRVIALEAELVTVRRERDAARAEVAHRDATMRGGGW